MIRKMVQCFACLFPPPFNVWLHRSAGARIGRHVFLHPGVLLLAQRIEIGGGAKVRFGTVINVRSFRLGRKSRIGYFTVAKGISDLHIGDACVTGPKVLFNCDRAITLEYYVGIGTGSMLYTHGCFLPTTEGFRTTFAPIVVKSKSWVTLSCTIGPGVTIGERSIVLPGTVVLSDVPSDVIVSSQPARLRTVPRTLDSSDRPGLEEIARRILSDYCLWAREFLNREAEFDGESLRFSHRGRRYGVVIDKDGDISLLTRAGATAGGMYFNLADLTTDSRRHPAKRAFEEYLGRNHGLTFLCRPS